MRSGPSPPRSVSLPGPPNRRSAAQQVAHQRHVADDRVVAAVAVEAIRPGPALQPVVAEVAEHDVRARSGVHGVAAAPAQHPVIAIAGIDAVVAAPRHDIVVTVGAQHRVPAATGEHAVAARARVDGVVPPRENTRSLPPFASMLSATRVPRMRSFPWVPTMCAAYADALRIPRLNNSAR